MRTVIVFFAGNERGGAAAHITTHARTVARSEKRHHYHFVSLGDGPLTASVVSTSVKSVVIAAGAVGGMRQLKQYLRTIHNPLLHAHGPRLNILAALAAKQVNVPWTSTIHSHPYFDFMGSRLKSRIYPRLNIWSLQKAIGLFVVQSALADALPVKTVLDVPNAIDLPALQEPREAYATQLKERLQLPLSTRFIGMAARFDPVKNIDVLIRAIAKLTSDDTHLLLAGDGPERQTLEALVSQLGLQNRVHFLGFLTDMPAFYAALDVHVLPSKSEGTPFSMLEAGHYGVVNVGSDIPSLRELLRDGEAGPVVPVGDVESLAQRLDELSQNETLRQRYVQNFHTQVLPHFAPEKMLEAYERGYTVLEEDILRSGRY
jgi:glycosyltransferase involved in cell wall biosynthesis